MTRSAFTWRRRGVWHRVRLGAGIELRLQKPRQSDLYAMIEACPSWCKMVEVYRRVFAGEDVGAEERLVTIPAAEYRACSAFLARCTLAIVGVVDEEGEPVVWQRLSEDERVDLYECLPLGDVQHAWGQVVGKLGVDNDPTLLDRLAEAERAALADDDVDEEE